MLKPSLACLACMHMVSASAAPADPLSEMDYFAEQPVVLSASRLSQPVNRAPAAVTVITREMIEASGFRHLVDVLRLVPGFVVGWSGGNMPAATHIGLSDAFPHWMQIMVDGRSIYNPAYGHTTWRGIPLTLDDVDRIEVVRGPNAANDGLNSMLGTIHIFTRHSAATQGGMGEVAAGDKQYREANLRYGRETRNGSWRLGLLGREDERHGVAQDHATDVQLNFRGDFQPTLKDDVMLQLGASRGLWQGSNVGFVQNDEQHAYYLSGYANLQWKRVLGQYREWSLQMHHTFNQNQEAIPLPAPLDSMSGNYRTTGSGIQVNYLDMAVPDLRTSLVAEYRLNRVYLPALLADDAGVRDAIFRLSGAAEWSVTNEWVLHAGAMLEHHSDTASTYFSPRLAVNWLPSSEHAFRLGVSQGMSALGLYASNTDIKLTMNGLIQDQLTLSVRNLDPERITSSELGYIFSKPGWGLNLDIRAFHNRIYDIVDTEYIAFPDLVDGRTLTYVNKPEVKQRGLEYQLRWRPAPRSWLVLSQSWIATTSDPGTDYYPDSVPSRTLSLLATQSFAGIDVSLGYYRMSEMRWFVAGFESKYNRLDLRLAKDWKTRDGKVEAALVIQGLLGEEFESFADDLYQQQYFKRRGYLSLKYEFR
jgi:iron complex outermembrane receptor protein